MNILVDSGLKKKIQIENRKHRRGIYYLWLFEKIFFALVIAYAILLNNPVSMSPLSGDRKPQIRF